MPMEKSYQVGIYCRLSEEDRNKRSPDDDSGSIHNQKSMLLQYAHEQGWIIYEIYSDDDYTGADRSRPAFRRLLEDARRHKFDIVLCKSQSRFTRELELVEKYIHGLFPLWGIRFVSVVDNADTANKGNKKSRQINGLVNEWYLEDLSDNIRSVLTNRRQNGLHIGSFALYGYQKDPDRKGHLLIDEEAAAVVHEIFTLFAQGHGKTAIARMLNARGIPNPTAYKHLHGLRYQPPAGRTGTLWKYAAISSMLHNEIYLGNMIQGKYGSISYKTKQNRPRPPCDWYVVEGTHEPIIDRALWDRVQTLLARNAKPFTVGTIGLFAGKVCCAHCGGAMRSTKSHGRRYLQCACHAATPNACIGSFIAVDRLADAVLAQLRQFYEEYLDTAALAKQIKPQRDLQRQTTRLRAQLAQYEARCAQDADALRSLYTDKVKGLLSDNDFSTLLRDFSDEKERLSCEIPLLRERLHTLEALSTDSDRMHACIAQYTAPDHLTREMIDFLIASIAVSKRIPGTRRVPVEIHWNF